MEKVYIEGAINSIRVGMCQIKLDDTVIKNNDGTYTVKKNNPVILYDTSGPYGDVQYKADHKAGLPCGRKVWYAHRKDIVHPDGKMNGRKEAYCAREGKIVTQMYYAKRRMLTPEMEYVAIRENQQIEGLGLKSYITPDFVRKEVAAGRAVIPANLNHVEIEPMIIGGRFLVKINSNVSLESEFSEADLEKIRLKCFLGVDSLMDISVENKSSDARNGLIRNSPIPVGTPPLYQAMAKVNGHVEGLSWELFRDTLVEQLEQGVDFVSIHAAMRRDHLKMTANRLTGIVSTTGKILSEWMKMHREENFLYTHFNEICEIARHYDAVISLGSGLRPGSVYDANDRAHFAELSGMRKLLEMAWDQYVQVMAEGPGHIPMNKIESYMKEYRYVCRGIPFFSPGMMTSDLAMGYEHVASAIGGAQMAWHGASLIGGLKSQQGIACQEEMQANLLSYKIAAHSADLAKGHPGAQVRDNAFSKARYENRESDWLKLSLCRKLEILKLEVRS
jgi:phosphomethylpyrimidine synthase